MIIDTTPVYRWEKDGWWREYEHDQVVFDEYYGTWHDHVTGHRVEHHRDRPAKWWAVAMYEAGSAYGGPEEGGWWYNVGELIEHHRIRFFDNYAEAKAYYNEMWDLAKEWNEEIRGYDYHYVVEGFTEMMPHHHFPEKRPYYS